MGTITIRNLPPEVIQALKKTASRNSHSMEQEARLILSRSVMDRYAAMQRLEEL